VVSQLTVEVFTGCGCRVGVYKRRPKFRYFVKECVLCRYRHLVGVDQGEPAVDDDGALGPQSVPEPSQAQLGDVDYTGCTAESGFASVHNGRIDGVHQTSVDLASGVLEDEQDGHRDGQADRRIGPRPTEGDTAGAGEDGERCEAVGTGVKSVGDECGRADPLADLDPQPGDRLVTEEADDGGGRHRAQMRDVLRMDKALDRFVPRDHGRCGDDRDDRDAREVLGPHIPIRVAPVGRSPPDDEGERERQRGQRVGDVVQRVAEQRHRARPHRDHSLQKGGDAEPTK